MAMIVINGLVMWPEVQRILDSCCSWCTAVPPTYGRLDPSCLLYIAHARILDAAAHVCLKQLVLLYLVPSITRNLTTDLTVFYVGAALQRMKFCPVCKLRIPNVFVNVNKFISYSRCNSKCLGVSSQDTITDGIDSLPVGCVNLSGCPGVY
ncbi:hypothetical protein KY285_021576 [Solanum tuberosum]|nr:hypothetical protein KY284_021638 [Solanum tuberosum]KAH0694479.1 hypothetical protein KY285_021576 [Solanum tuberosum]